MRVYDLEQGRSVERLNGHARITPLPTKLFTPGQRVFTPRYRLFIPSSTNLPPAVMLRFDRPLERIVGPAALLRRVGCRVTKPGRGEESRGAGFHHTYFRYAGGQPQVTCSACWGSASSFACCATGQHRATQRHEPVTAPPRSGCDVAVLAAPRRQGPSATGFRPGYHDARTEGWAINHEKMQCLWREEGLRVPPRRRHKGHGSSTAPPAVIADAPNRVWALDFQFDVTTD